MFTVFPSYSENQAARIDEEVKKIIDMCQKETEKILTKNKSKLLTMAEVLMEKETIYAEEVDLIISGKSKQEVINYIDNKDKKTSENKDTSDGDKIQEKSEEIEKKENKNSADYVDNLIKTAEKRLQDMDNIKQEENAELKDTHQNVSHETETKKTTRTKSAAKKTKTKSGTTKTANSRSTTGTKKAASTEAKTESKSV